MVAQNNAQDGLSLKTYPTQIQIQLNITQKSNFYVFPASELSTFKSGQLPTTIHYSVENIQSTFYTIGDITLISKGLACGVRNPNPSFVEVKMKISSFVPPTQQVDSSIIAIIVVVCICSFIVSCLLCCILGGLGYFYFLRKK